MSRLEEDAIRHVIATALTALVLTSACGSTTGEPDSSAPPDASGSDAPGSSTLADLQGRVLVADTVDSRKHRLVLGTQIRITFDDDTVQLQAGCNSMSGTARIENGQLVVDSLAGTEMGCDPQRMDQDTWLVHWLTSKPTISVFSDSVQLAGSGTTAVLTNEERLPTDDDGTGDTADAPADPDSPVSSDD